MAVLDVSVIRPAFEESAEVSPQAADSAPIVDLLRMVVVIGDRQRAQHVVSVPALTPWIVGVDVFTVAVSPQLPPAVLVRLSAVAEEFRISLDAVGQFVRGIGVKRVAGRLRNDRLLIDERMIVILNGLRSSVISGREPSRRSAHPKR